MTRTELLYKVIKERVLLLDGAMGSLIQTYKLEEDDYRGERFKHHHMPIKGNNDILSLSRPDIIKEMSFNAGFSSIAPCCLRNVN